VLDSTLGFAMCNKSCVQGLCGVAIELVGRGRAGVFTAPLFVQERAPGWNLDIVSA
jgi:hypothetical protein